VLHSRVVVENLTNRLPGLDHVDRALEVEHGAGEGESGAPLAGTGLIDALQLAVPRRAIRDIVSESRGREGQYRQVMHTRSWSDVVDEVDGAV